MLVSTAKSWASHALAIGIIDAVRHRDPARGTVEQGLALTEEEQQVRLLALEPFDWDRAWETAFLNPRAALREEAVPRPIAGKRP